MSDELFGAPDLNNLKTKEISYNNKNNALNNEIDKDLKEGLFENSRVTSFEQSKIIDTDCELYVKRCERELIKGNYIKAKEEIDKAIKFSKNEKEKKHCIKEKLRLLVNEDYVKFVCGNIDEFNKQYGLIFLIDTGKKNCTNSEIDLLIIGILVKLKNLSKSDLKICLNNIKNKKELEKYIIKNSWNIYRKFDLDYTLEIIEKNCSNIRMKELAIVNIIDYNINNIDVDQFIKLEKYIEFNTWILKKYLEFNIDAILKKFERKYDFLDKDININELYIEGFVENINNPVNIYKYDYDENKFNYINFMKIIEKLYNEKENKVYDINSILIKYILKNKSVGFFISLYLYFNKYDFERNLKKNNLTKLEILENKINDKSEEVYNIIFEEKLKNYIEEDKEKLYNMYINYMYKIYGYNDIYNIINEIINNRKHKINIKSIETLIKIKDCIGDTIDIICKNEEKIIKSINKYTDFISFKNIIINLNEKCNSKIIEKIILKSLTINNMRNKYIQSNIIDLYIYEVCIEIDELEKKKKIVKVYSKKNYAEEIKCFIKNKSENKYEEKLLTKIFIEESIKNNYLIELDYLNECFTYVFKINEGIKFIEELITDDYLYKEILYFKLSYLRLLRINKENLNRKIRKLKTIEKELILAEELSINHRTEEYLLAIYNVLLDVYYELGFFYKIKYKRIKEKIELKRNANYIEEGSKYANKVGISLMTIMILASIILATVDTIKTDEVENSYSTGEISYGNDIIQDEKMKQDIMNDISDSYEDILEKSEKKRYEDLYSKAENNNITEPSEEIKKALPERYSEYGDYDSTVQQYFMEMEDLLTRYYTDYEKAISNADYSYVSGDLVDDGQLSKELKISIPQYKHKSVYVKHFSIYNFKVNGNQASFNLDTVFIVDNERIQIETQRMTTYYDYYIQDWLIDNYTDWDIIFKQNYNSDTDYFDFTNYRDYF